MAHRPLVSILTPAYKAEPYIGQAIESVLAQTMPDWELIVVEDCSPDNTAQVVEQYLGDPRIKLIRNTQNMGAAASRNRALDVAQGEWITLLDADDWYEPQRLERLLCVAEETGERVVYDLSRAATEQGELGQPLRFSDIFPIPRHLTSYTKYEFAHGHVGGQPLMCHGIIRDYKINFPLGVIKGEDFIMTMRVVARAGSAVLTPESLYNYRIYPLSTLHQSRQNWRRNLHLSHIMYNTLLTVPEVQEDPVLYAILQQTYRRIVLIESYAPFVRSLKTLNLNDMLWLYRQAPGLVWLFLKRFPFILGQKIFRRTTAWKPHTEA